MQETELISRLKKLMKKKQSRSFYASVLGISESEVKSLIKQIRHNNYQKQAETAAYITELEEKIVEHDLEKGTVKSSVVVDFEPKSVDELYELHKIDKTTYKIVNYWSKLKSCGKFTSSVFASTRKPADYTVEDFTKFLSTYEPKPIPINVSIDLEVEDKKEVDISISIADFHLAKKTIDGETIETRRDFYLRILSDLLKQATASFHIRKSVFVISNDFFHTDNYQNQTTNGTPQDTLIDYDHEYEEGFDLLVAAIAFVRMCSQEVEVVLVQGNHDRTKSFYLAHALELQFKADEAITFQRNHSTTKCVVLGNTFIGFHHGNGKIDQLPLLFSTGADAPAWGNAKYREVHTGDKHHYMAKEFMGVRIQQMPSLSGTDRWHRDGMFVHSVRAALLMAYHPITGKCGEFEERV